MSGKKGMKPYPKAVKLEAVRLFYKEGLTRQEVAERLGVSKGRVETWLRIYRREGEAGLQKPRPGRPPKRANTEAYIRRLEMENDLRKNSIPSCVEKGSRSAISGHLRKSRKIRSECDV